MQGIGADATGVKWKEDEFSRFTDMAYAPVVCVDKDMRIEIWNDYTAKLTGFL